MALTLVFLFVVGYALIAFEHPLKIDKAASALLAGTTCWLLLAFGMASMPAWADMAAGHPDVHEFVAGALSEHFVKISEILFFLLGAMTIVELIDAHDGFRIITDRISTTHRTKLLWIIAIITFFLSAALDNMTTAIIMSALLRKMIRQKELLWLFGGFVIIAANAGGAWSPIGDVTTIMLWIGGQVTTLNIMQATFPASLACLLAPLLLATVLMRGEAALAAPRDADAAKISISDAERMLVFALGSLGLLSVPVFKNTTHLPPYMGVLLALGVLWLATELLHRRKEQGLRRGLSIAATLQRIDTPAILFFLGILLAVGALETSGHLHHAANWLDQTFAGEIYQITGLIGLLSAVVDNVPLVAACMGMYDFATYPPDHDFWELLAYCAGTGGSILIIGSAAGVAAMGLLKIDFLWYLRKIAPYAALGYFAGMAVYYLQHQSM